MIRDAFISSCATYRYQLYRKWAESDRMPILWVMLNPSTADHHIDDPTIRRCIGFSKAWGYGAMWVGNVYAYRATEPKILKQLSMDTIRGPDNPSKLWDMASRCALTVAAWGTQGPLITMPPNIQSPGGVWCLGTSKAGYPKHPLYVKGDTALEPWPRCSSLQREVSK